MHTQVPIHTQACMHTYAHTQAYMHTHILTHLNKQEIYTKNKEAEYNCKLVQPLSENFSSIYHALGYTSWECVYYLY